MDYYEEDSFIMDQNFIKDRIGQLVWLREIRETNQSGSRTFCRIYSVPNIRQVDAFNTDGISNLRIFWHTDHRFLWSWYPPPTHHAEDPLIHLSDEQRWSRHPGTPLEKALLYRGSKGKRKWRIREHSCAERSLQRKMVHFFSRQKHEVKSWEMKFNCTLIMFFSKVLLRCLSC